MPVDVKEYYINMNLYTLQETVIAISNVVIPFTMAFCLLVIIFRIIQLGKKCFDDRLFYESIKTIGVAAVTWVAIRVIILFALITYLYL
jgi:hypothetical protein